MNTDKEIVIGRFKFRLEYRNGYRGSFYHMCRMYMDGKRVEQCEKQYYNRTWELYDYQTVILKAIEQFQRRTKDDGLTQQLKILHQLVSERDVITPQYQVN